jgi:hypothetical protein
MPRYELLITVSGYTKAYVEASDKVGARAMFNRGDWEESNPNYELEEITEETL